MKELRAVSERALLRLCARKERLRLLEHPAGNRCPHGLRKSLRQSLLHRRNRSLDAAGDFKHRRPGLCFRIPIREGLEVTRLDFDDFVVRLLAAKGHREFQLVNVELIGTLSNHRHEDTTS